MNDGSGDQNVVSDKGAIYKINQLVNRKLMSLPCQPIQLLKTNPQLVYQILSLQ